MLQPCNGVSTWTHANPYLVQMSIAVWKGWLTEYQDMNYLCLWTDIWACVWMFKVSLPGQRVLLHSMQECEADRRGDFSFDFYSRWFRFAKHYTHSWFLRHSDQTLNTYVPFQALPLKMVVMLMCCCDRTSNVHCLFFYNHVKGSSLFFYTSYIAYYNILCVMCFHTEHSEMLFW